MAERPKRDTDKSIQDAVAWFAFVNDVERDQRDREQDDLSFQTAEGAWPEDVKESRQATTVTMAGPGGTPMDVPIPARPMISIASLDEPIALNCAQQRKADLAPSIHALSEDASDETADILQGIYRGIERDSHADRVRSWSYERGAWCGTGAYRIDKAFDPYGGHPFDQKLVIRRILDQATVYFDPYAIEPDKRDGLRAMVVVTMPWATYKRKYPKSKVANFTETDFQEYAQDYEGWITNGTDDTRTVRVAEDWRVEITQRKVVLLDDNSASFEDEIPEGRTAQKNANGDYAQWAYQEERRVFWRTINIREELEPEQEWDGQYIPLIRVVGRELQPVRGKQECIGMVANAKGAVRMTNMAASNAIEMANTEPWSPFMAQEGAFEGYESQIQQMNTRRFPVLFYRKYGLDGTPVDKPERTRVDLSRMGPSMELLHMGRDFVQTATQTYDPALGKQPTAHRSGRAIVALQDQTVESLSPYLDNFANISLIYEADVILDLIPRVYDRPGRIARILDRQDKTQRVMLNAPFVPSQTNGGTLQPLPNGTPAEQSASAAFVADPNHPAKHYDLNKGRYGVEVTIRKSYKDQRQEGASEMGMILQADPALMQVIGPEYFEYRGEPWAEKVAGLLRKQRDHMMPWLSDQPQNMPTPQQAMQIAQENQQLKAALAQAAQEKAGKVIETQGKIAVTQIQEQADTQRAREANEVKLAVAELSAKVERMQLFYEERARLGTQQHEMATSAADASHEKQMAAAQADHDRAMAAQAHATATMQADQAHGQTLDQNAQQAALQPEPADTGDAQ